MPNGPPPESARSWDAGRGIPGATRVAMVVDLLSVARLPPVNKRPVALRPRLATGLPLSSWLILVMPWMVEPVSAKWPLFCPALYLLPRPNTYGYPDILLTNSRRFAYRTFSPLERRSGG
jgi:hypothetical protein